MERQRARFRCVVSAGVDRALCGQIAGGLKQAGDPEHTYSHTHTHSHTETSSGASGGFLACDTCVGFLLPASPVPSPAPERRSVSQLSHGEQPWLRPRGGVPMTKAERGEK